MTGSSESSLSTGPEHGSTQTLERAHRWSRRATAKKTPMDRIADVRAAVNALRVAQALNDTLGDDDSSLFSSDIDVRAPAPTGLPMDPHASRHVLPSASPSSSSLFTQQSLPNNAHSDAAVPPRPPSGLATLARDRVKAGDSSCPDSADSAHTGMASYHGMEGEVGEADVGGFTRCVQLGALSGHTNTGSSVSASNCPSLLGAQSPRVDDLPLVPGDRCCHADRPATSARSASPPRTALVDEGDAHVADTKRRLQWLADGQGLAHLRINMIELNEQLRDMCMQLNQPDLVGQFQESNVQNAMLRPNGFSRDAPALSGERLAHFTKRVEIRFLWSIHQASSSGDEVGAVNLVQQASSQELNAVDDCGRTALHYCAAQGYPNVCRAICSRCDFRLATALDSTGCSALHYAAARGHSSICDLLLNLLHVARVDSMSATCCGGTALHYAARGGCPETCRVLLEHPNFACQDRRDSQGYTALHRAAHEGHHDVCTVLLNSRRFAAVNETSCNGSTALHVAASRGHAAVCHTLLRHPRFTAGCQRDAIGRLAADVSVDHAQTVFRYGAQHNPGVHPGMHESGELGHFLPAPRRECKAPAGGGPTAHAGCDVGCRGGHLASLFEAIDAKSSEAALRLLLQARLLGHDLNARNCFGCTLLHCAAAKGLATVCQALLDDVSFTECDGTYRAFGWTALHFAASGGHAQTCLALLEHPRFGSEDMRDTEGWTALHFAAAGGHPSTCKTIIEHPRFKATQAKNGAGLTAFEVASGEAMAAMVAGSSM